MLYPFNLITYKVIKAAFSYNNKVGLVQGTGTGKSCIAAKLIEDCGEGAKILLLTTNEESARGVLKHSKSKEIEVLCYSGLVNLQKKP